MKFEQRLEKLEEQLLKSELDPVLDAELSAWFKDHPGFQIAQPESCYPVLPEHLCHAFHCRLVYYCKKKNINPNLCGLLEVYKDVFS